MSEKKRGPGGKTRSELQKQGLKPNVAAPGEKADADRPYTGALEDSRLERQMRDMDDGQLIKRLAEERKKLNAIAQTALENDGSLDVQSLHEQNRVVETLINEALLRRIEDLD